MKLSMLKLLTIVSLLSTSLLASKKIDESILNYETKKVSSILKRRDIILNNVDILLKKDLKQNGWYGYTFNLTFTVQGKTLSQKDTLFTNGDLITSDLINSKTKSSFKDIMYPKLSKKFFDKEYFIAGNPKSKNTLVLFSDPLCPICVDEVPTIIKNVMDNPQNIALYYYSLPLPMHPTAAALSKASKIAHQMGIKDVQYKLYSANLGSLYKAYEEKDDQIALNHFNTLFKTNITVEQINSDKLNKKLQYQLDMSEEAFVNGTPTLFLNGEIDKTRTEYEKYLK